MKKLSIVLGAVLISVYAVLAFLGRNGDHAPERIYYHAMKLKQKIAANPDVAPPKILGAIEKDLRAIINKYPKSYLRRTAHIMLAEFYLGNKNYEKAILAITEILGGYKGDVYMLSQGQFLKGMYYERKGDWAGAKREYGILRDKFASTQLGLQVPIYIGRHYLVKGMDAETDNAYNSAIRFYKKMDLKYRGSMLGYSAASLLAQCYLDRKQFEEAGNAVSDIIEHYPPLLAVSQQLPAVEMIYVRALKRPERAIEIFKRVRERATDSRMIKFLDQKIAAYGKLIKS